MSKIICIYHSIDLDGYMSAAIVKHWFNKEQNQKEELARNGEKGILIDTIEFLGFNYGDSIPNLSNYNKVILCDISFPVNIMNGLQKQLTDNFIWLDHHISAISNPDIYENWIKGLRTTTNAACELTWQYFFPTETMPEIVRLLGRYDCFGHKGTNEEQKVLEFQYGARTLITNYEDAYFRLNLALKIKGIEEEFWDNGVAVYKYLCQDAKQSYKNGFEIHFRFSPTVEEHSKLGFTKDTLYKFICINKERFNPINFAIDYHKDGYDGCACFHFDGKQYTFSLYNDNGLVDCSMIAKQFGGGGHKGAAGFRVKSLNEIGL